MTQHLLPNTTIQGEKYRIEQKPRYLKVFLSNSADSEIVRNRISLLHTVNNVNVTNPHTGDITVHHSTNKANAEMEKDVENTLRTYYSVTSGNDIALMHTKHLLGLLKRNSQEYLQLKTAINSFENDEFRHAFDDYRLC